MRAGNRAANMPPSPPGADGDADDDDMGGLGG